MGRMKYSERDCVACGHPPEDHGQNVCHWRQHGARLACDCVGYVEPEHIKEKRRKNEFIYDFSKDIEAALRQMAFGDKVTKATLRKDFDNVRISVKISRK